MPNYRMTHEPFPLPIKPSLHQNFLPAASMVCLFCASSSPRSHHPSTNCLMVLRLDLDRSRTAPPPAPSMSRIGGLAAGPSPGDSGIGGIGGITATGTGRCASNPFTPSSTTSTDLVRTLAVARGGCGCGTHAGIAVVDSSSDESLRSTHRFSPRAPPPFITDVPRLLGPPPGGRGAGGMGAYVFAAAAVAAPPRPHLHWPSQSLSAAGPAAIFWRRQRQIVATPEKAKSTQRAMERPQTAFVA